MQYRSTRGQAPQADFETVLTAGLAPDGGLYVPDAFPKMSRAEIAGVAGRGYADVAADVLTHFTGDAFAQDRLRAMAREAYAGFDHKETAPLVQVGEEDWILELFHGPTLAFKDFAMAAATANTQKGILGWIEKTGNRLPDPVFIFFYLIVALVIVSIVAAIAGYSAPHPTQITDAGDAVIINAVSLLSAENIQRLWVDMPKTFTHFHPLGYVLVVMKTLTPAEAAD